MNAATGKTAIIVDTCCDVPEELAEKPFVYTVALHVNYDRESFLDRIEITPAMVYDRLRKGDIPSTSTPTEAEMYRAFDRVIADGYEQVICVHISSNISGTCELARTAAANRPELEAGIIDTLNIGYGSGAVASRAIEYVDSGMPFEEVLRRAQGFVGRTRTFFIVDTLEYLYKGGRITKPVYQLGSILNLRPILTCDETGRYAVVGKARGRRRSIKKAVELANKAMEGKRFVCAIANGDSDDDERDLLLHAQELFPDADRVFDAGQISPVLTVHTGPGLIGLVVQEAD